MTLPQFQFGNRVTFGTTGSGKTTAEVIDIVAAALLGTIAIVVIDPHFMSLAWNAYIHLVARGLWRRVLFDRLSNFDRVLGYQFLRPSTANQTNRRDAENEQTIREFIDVLLRRRDMQSLASHPLIEEFVFLACQLIIYQKHPTPASEIRYAFEPQEPHFHRLISGCTHEEVRRKFLAIASGQIKSGQYAAARRLISGVCGSPAFTTRCHTTFDLNRFLNRRGILLIEGASHGISPDTASTIMGAIILQVFHFIRSRPKPYPRVLLVIDEATNANLIGAAGHEVRALAELQKRGLDIHILCQSPNFPNSFVEDGVLTNCIEHHWFFPANDAVAQKAARDLGDAEYRQSVRSLRRGQRYVKRLNRVTFEQVTPLPDPWTFPGLADSKARKALTEIQKRPEYWSPSECPQTDSNQTAVPSPDQTQSTSNLTPNKSPSTSPTNTSSSADTSLPTSPAARLNTERSRNCGTPGNSSESESSS